MKDTIIKIIKLESDSSIRFEVLERFYTILDCEDDVRFVIDVLLSDCDPCVRHEAAAQLFRIEEQRPHLMKGVKRQAIDALLDRAHRDESTVVRHESIEALGYLGDENALRSLEALALDRDLDIRSTAEIALRTCRRRIVDGVSAGELCSHIIEKWKSKSDTAAFVS